MKVKADARSISLSGSSLGSMGINAASSSVLEHASARRNREFSWASEGERVVS